MEKMKVYSLQVPINANYAKLKADLNQDYNMNPINVWWEEWNVDGNEVKDFLNCNRATIAKQSVANELNERFMGLSLHNVNIIRTEREKSSKRKLKWLPDEDPILKFIFTTIELKLLSQSSVKYSDGSKYLSEIDGISELRGNLIIPRVEGKGFFFSSHDINGYDFFKPENTRFLLCTENVKEFCEKQGYTNIVFLEVGDIV